MEGAAESSDDRTSKAVAAGQSTVKRRPELVMGLWRCLWRLCREVNKDK